MRESVILILFYLVIVVVLSILIRHKSKSQNQQYDEMQLKNRAEAYKRAFFTMIVLLVGIIVFDTCSPLDLPQYALSGILIIVVMLSFLVFATYSIWNDAFFYIGQNWKGYFSVCIAVGLVQCIDFVSTLIRYFNGKEYAQNVWHLIISKASTSCVMTLTFFTLAVVILVKQLRENRISEE
ncbi:MAG: hypothetical protein K6G06_08600 [Butyrivibrio sp.]|nr:hypothetical protein [Butyrivibrio sp.]